MMYKRPITARGKLSDALGVSARGWRGTIWYSAAVGRNSWELQACSHVRPGKQLDSSDEIDRRRYKNPRSERPVAIIGSSTSDVILIHDLPFLPISTIKSRVNNPDTDGAANLHMN